jgi:hypothetical protein
VLRWIPLLLVAAPGVAAAYPIPPQTLWALTTKADLVAVAETKNVEVGDEHGFATLKILETWRGPRTKEVRVRYRAQVICPAPPRFVPNEMVLVFLERDGDDFEVVGLSYGTLYPHFDELAAYEAAVRSVRDEASLVERRKWLVERAARRATRWHGVYELTDHDRRRWYPPRRLAAQPSAVRRHVPAARAQRGPQMGYHGAERERIVLTDADRQTLAHGLVREPSADDALFAALTLLDDFVDPRLDRVAVAALDELAREPPPYDFAEYLEIVLKRLGHFVELPAEEEREIEDPLLDAPDERQRWALAYWQKLRPTLDIDTADVELDTRLPRVLGTGSDTPP